MYADDTTLYCIRDSANEVVSTLNKALSELNEWCIANQLTPHPQKSEVMLLSRQRIIGPLAPVFLGDQMIKWVKKTKLLGMVIDENLSWNEHTGLNNIFSCLRAKFKMCLQKHILFRFCDLNIVKMSVF
jgi:hypothetical protein